MIFDDEILNCNVEFSTDYKRVFINGFLKNPNSYSNIMLIAPNPFDRMTNYSGSGLPFPCADIAFENTPNKLLIDKSGIFTTTFSYPNSFYLPNGKVKVISSLYLVFNIGDNIQNKRLELLDLCILRTLSNRSSRKGPEFYGAKDYLLPIANAEDVMREYSKVKIENDIG